MLNDTGGLPVSHLSVACLQRLPWSFSPIIATKPIKCVKVNCDLSFVRPGCTKTALCIQKNDDTDTFGACYETCLLSAARG